MWGKVFQCAFTGSMRGTGANAFAVWSYILAHAIDEFVEINTELVAFYIGITPEEVEVCIQSFCSPDPKSRSQLEEGRKLIHQDGYRYSVVNWSEYNSRAKAFDMRQASTIKKRAYRDKLKAVPALSRTDGGHVPQMSRTFALDVDVDSDKTESQTNTQLQIQHPEPDQATDTDRYESAASVTPFVEETALPF